MKEKKENKERKKIKYLKPVLIKHKKLKDITAQSTQFTLGCTKFFV